MIRIVDSQGRPVPLWLVRMLSDGTRAGDPFWAARRASYKVVTA